VIHIYPKVHLLMI